MNWQKLRLLRERFITGQTDNDYWCPELLELYDKTLGERIRWKWRSVLSELQLLGRLPDSRLPVIDWACGTGAALTAYAEFVKAPRSVQCWDRSAMAVSYTLNSLEKAGIQPDKGSLCWDKAVVLLSHVINELSAGALSILLSNLRRASTVIWVEPGEKRAAQRLVAIRDELSESFSIVAPCTHQKRCPAARDKASWCHFFAKLPPEVFTDPFWSQVQQALAIDIATVPVSYLVAAREEFVCDGSRVIGRPRRRSGHTRITVCSEQGLEEKVITRSKHKQLSHQVLASPFRSIVP